MNTEDVKKMISDWLYENRPDLRLTEKFIDDIYNEIKEEILTTSRTANILVVNEFLRLNYTSAEFLILLDLIEENPKYKERFDEYKELGFLYDSEVGALVNRIKYSIKDKYEGSLEELVNNKRYQEEIDSILEEYMAS